MSRIIILGKMELAFHFAYYYNVVNTPLMYKSCPLSGEINHQFDVIIRRTK